MRSAEAALALALAFAGALPAAGLAADCAPDQVDLRDADTSLRFHVEVMDTEAGREKGLMFRQSMPKFSGMLFVYEEPQPVAFWMKNTLIPLDMIFIRADGIIANIETAVPLSLDSVPSAGDAAAVLEIAGGRSAELKIKAGDKVDWPH